MKDPKIVDRFGRLAAALLVVVFALLVSEQLIRPFLDARRNLSALREAVEILASAENDVDRLDIEIRQVAAEIQRSEAELPVKPLKYLLDILRLIFSCIRKQINKNKHCDPSSHAARLAPRASPLCRRTRPGAMRPLHPRANGLRSVS